MIIKYSTAKITEVYDDKKEEEKEEGKEKKVKYKSEGNCEEGNEIEEENNYIN